MSAVVSAIIPTHNRPVLLSRAVRSVLEQSFEDLELIVVDDGSAGDVRESLAEFSDPRLRCFRIEHSGVSAARNYGARHAGGQWISFLDSDDAWCRRKLERQLQSLEQEGTYRVVYTNETWIRNGRRVNQGQRHRKFGGWIYHRCLPLCIISPSSVLMERSLFETAGLFDESLPVCEDYDLWLRISARYPVLFLDEPLITKYGGHPDQLSRSRWGMDRFRVEALRKALESGLLTPQQQRWTARELIRKSAVLLGGFRKRENRAEESRYRSLVERWEAAASRDVPGS